MYLRLLILAVTVCMVAAFAQSALDAGYQVKVFPNLNVADCIINVLNTGGQASTTSVNGGSVGGNICVNMYAFDALDEQEVSCCACQLTANQAFTTTALTLTAKTLTGTIPTNGIVVKLVASLPVAGACSPATAVAITGGGMAAWGTNVHTVPITTVTETAFTPATLNANELSRLTTLCGFINNNGSTFGQCTGCPSYGVAGASKQ